jgi:hypothetical protein
MKTICHTAAILFAGCLTVSVQADPVISGPWVPAPVVYTESVSLDDTRQQKDEACACSGCRCEERAPDMESIQWPPRHPYHEHD